MIRMDVHEPIEVKQLLEQSVQVSVIPLNQHGFADYHWVAVDGHTIQVERKQIDEILGGLDHVEEQLTREIGKADETILLYEGTVSHYHDVRPSVRSWKLTKGGKVVAPHHTYHISYTGLQAWFYQLDKSGITVFHTFDVYHTARAIVAWYNSSQKLEHTTLKRYIKDKAYSSDRNPHILNLMNIKGGGIGEEYAKALIDRFGTFWSVVNQTVDILAETRVGKRALGTSAAIKLLKAIGRLQ